MSATEHPATTFAGYTQATTPTDDDNPNGAVAVGDLWVDTDDGKVYSCTSLAPIVFTLVGPGSGTGDVVGPASAVDRAVVLFNTTTGKLVKDGGVGTDGQAFKSNGTGADPAFQDDLVTVTIVIDGGGSAITTGVKGYLEVPFAATITQVTLLADQSGSIVIDIWKDTYANYPPVDADSITASAPPTITTTTKSQDATLTGWTTAIAAGDILGFNVDSITTVTRVTLSLKCKRL